MSATRWNDIYFVVSALGWGIIFARCFENTLGDYLKNVCPDTKRAYHFWKTRQKKSLCKIALANATYFQQVLENYVKARQTNEN